MGDCEYGIKDCIQNGDCDNCVDNRYMPAVNEYASTCDGCGELTMHIDLEMDKKTQLGYCQWCIETGGWDE